MIRELDRVVLADRIDEADLEIGDIGTVVFVYKQHKGYEVEFITLTGETVAVVSVLPSQIRIIRDREIAHVRAIA
ncbi:MAG: DUF4926 domain-containing protein [Pseudanabaena sp. CAN_BIN31]|nr:DUF4926 domain-containing protein [Pseudanabaena sp. CAN_BIN31]